MITQCEWITLHVSQKTAPFYFCNNFVKPSSILVIFGTHVLQYISNKMMSNRQSLLISIFIIPRKMHVITNVSYVTQA